MGFVRDFLFGSPPEPPDYKPLAASSEKVAQMQLDYARERDAAAAQDRARLLDITGRTTAQQMAIAQQQANQASDYYNYAKSTFRPLEQRIAEEALRYDSDVERERLAGLAASDMQQALTNQAAIADRNLTRLGINPNSARFAALNNELSLRGAAQIAGAKTNARTAARDIGYGRLTNAVNVGRNYPATAQASAGLGLQGYGGVNQGQFGLQSALNQTALVPGQYLSGAQNSYNSAGNLLNTGFQNQFANYQTQGMQTAALLNAAGTAYAFAADGTPGGTDPADDGNGGKVKGPGTTTSDSILARLSKGEYVIPADVVQKKGVEFFDKILEKYHTPVAEQNVRKYGIRSA